MGNTMSDINESQKKLYDVPPECIEYSNQYDRCITRYYAEMWTGNPKSHFKKDSEGNLLKDSDGNYIKDEKAMEIVTNPSFIPGPHITNEQEADEVERNQRINSLPSANVSSSSLSPSSSSTSPSSPPPPTPSIPSIFSFPPTVPSSTSTPPPRRERFSVQCHDEWEDFSICHRLSLMKVIQTETAKYKETLEKKQKEMENERKGESKTN